MTILEKSVNELFNIYKDDVSYNLL